MKEILHVYGPEVPGGDAWLRGNRAALLRLRKALSMVLDDGDTIHGTDYEAADGEAYTLHIVLDDAPSDADSWVRSELPYTVVRDERPDVIGPWIEAGLQGGRGHETRG